jgi:hypothetical protein
MLKAVKKLSLQQEKTLQHQGEKRLYYDARSEKHQIILFYCLRRSKPQLLNIIRIIPYMRRVFSNKGREFDSSFMQTYVANTKHKTPPTTFNKDP